MKNQHREVNPATHAAMAPLMASFLAMAGLWTGDCIGDVLSHAQRARCSVKWVELAMLRPPRSGYIWLYPLAN